MKPFRWTLAKQEQLGSLIQGESSEFDFLFYDELAACAARVLAFSNDSQLVFVGRSPENIYDYLCGVFSDTLFSNRFKYLNISNRDLDISDIKQAYPKSYLALQNHFSDLELDPASLSKSKTCFVDLVSSGGTYKGIKQFIDMWCDESKADLVAINKHLGFVGITSRTKNSPNTERWQQHSPWLEPNKLQLVKNVSISRTYWDYLGNTQAKVTNPNRPENWQSSEILLPPRDEANIKALSRAHSIYTRGAAEKKQFASLMVKEPSVNQRWYRNLAAALK